MNENELKKIYKKIMRNSIAFWIYLIFLIFTVIFILSIQYYTLQVIRLFNLPQDYVFKFFWEPNFNNTNFKVEGQAVLGRQQWAPTPRFKVRYCNYL